MAPSKAARPDTGVSQFEPREDCHAGERDSLRDNAPQSQTQALVARLYPDRRGERYDVRFNGELLVRRSRDPECDLARALLAKGITGTVTILDGVTGKPRSAVIIEKAARLTVKEGPLRFAAYKSRPNRAPAGETRLPLGPIPDWRLRRAWTAPEMPQASCRGARR